MRQSKAKSMLKFYNSITQKIEAFKPIEKGKVKLYTCGPTVYDYSHIGNFRTFLFEDLLKRVLNSAPTGYGCGIRETPCKIIKIIETHIEFRP